MKTSGVGSSRQNPYIIEEPNLSDVNVAIDINGNIGVETPQGWAVFTRDEYVTNKKIFDRICKAVSVYIACQKVEQKYNEVLPYSWDSLKDYIDRPYDIDLYFSESIIPGYFEYAPDDNTRPNELVWKQLDTVFPGKTVSSAQPAQTQAAQTTQSNKIPTANTPASAEDEDNTILRIAVIATFCLVAVKAFSGSGKKKSKR